MGSGKYFLYAQCYFLSPRPLAAVPQYTFAKCAHVSVYVVFRLDSLLILQRLPSRYLLSVMGLHGSEFLKYRCTRRSGKNHRAKTGQLRGAILCKVSIVFLLLYLSMLSPFCQLWRSRGAVLAGDVTQEFRAKQQAVTIGSAVFVACISCTRKRAGWELMPRGEKDRTRLLDPVAVAVAVRWR